MANIGEVTVAVNYEITETSKQLLKSLIAEVLKEALTDGGAVVPFATVDALKAFIRQEVSDLLSETFPGSSEQSQQGE